MKMVISLEDFIREFERQQPDSFTRAGLDALFDNLIDDEDQSGKEMMLDVHFLCCEYSEYSSLEQFHRFHSAEDYPDMDSIQDTTHVIPVGKGEAFIIQVF